MQNIKYGIRWVFLYNNITNNNNNKYFYFQKILTFYNVWNPSTQ